MVRMQVYHHIVPLLSLLSGMVLASLGTFSLFRRKTANIGLFTLLMFAGTIIAVFYFLELACVAVKWKYFWLRMQFIGTASLSVIWLLTAAHFCGYRRIIAPKYIIPLFIIPAATVILVWTNEFHHMIWREIGIGRTAGLIYLDNSYGYWNWVHLLYTYGTFIVGSVLLITHAIRSKGLHRSQSIAFFISAIFPWILNVLFSIEIFKWAYIDVSPISFALTGIALWWAIFRYNLLDILPEAKEILLEHMKAGILVTDAKDRIIEMNSFVEKLFMVRFSDFIGRSVDALWPKLQETMPAEFDYKNDTGDYLFIEVDKTPITKKNGMETGSLYLIVNSTEKKKTAMTLKKTEEYLYRSQKYEALGRMAGGIAHDVNNIMTIIYNYAKLSFPGSGFTQEEMMGNLKEIMKAVERGQGLTRQLLAFSKAQIVSEDHLPLGVLMSEMNDMLRHFVKPEVEIIMEEKEDPGEIRGNRHQIEQMILNLVQNADDAMPEGGKVEVTWGKTFLFEHDLRDVHDVEPGVYSYFSISDTGEGIKQQDQEHIFDPFFTTREMGKGIGLGLSTVYGIVKQQRGHIEMESTAGSGTTFRIYLPTVED